jgi:predicted transcriptional regulator
MYRCNLSFRQLQTYLDFLVERKLVKRSKADESENTFGKYQTTAKGKAFIEAYKNIRALLSPLELEG